MEQEQEQESHVDPFEARARTALARHDQYLREERARQMPYILLRELNDWLTAELARYLAPPFMVVRVEADWQQCAISAISVTYIALQPDGVRESVIRIPYLQPLSAYNVQESAAPQPGTPVPVAASPEPEPPCDFCYLLEHDGSRVWHNITNEPDYRDGVAIVRDTYERFVLVPETHGNVELLQRSHVRGAFIARVMEITGYTEEQWLAARADITDVGEVRNGVPLLLGYEANRTRGGYEWLGDEVWPHLTALPQGVTEMMSVGYRPGTSEHGYVASNIFELLAHAEIPQRVADEVTCAAQRMVGYFYGTHITAAQMLLPENLGTAMQYDPSAMSTGEMWTEPFEPGDECVFCQRTTDESIVERLDSFQYEIDKESGADYRLLQTLSRAEKQAIRAELRAAIGTGRTFVPFDLTLLPQHLQRTLVIQWNHIFLRWLQRDLRYRYNSGHYYVVCSQREPVTTPSIRESGDAWVARTGYQHGASGGEEDSPEPDGVEPIPASPYMIEDIRPEDLI